MRRHPIHAIALAATAALSACALPIPSLGSPPATAPTNTRTLSAKERQDLSEVGGDELVSDWQFAMAAPGRAGSDLDTCVGDYAMGMLAREERDKHVRARKFKDCTRTCGYVPDGPYATMAKKYQEKCRVQNEANIAEADLKNARIAMDNLRQSGSPVGWYHNLVDARVSLDRAREKVGPDSPELREMFNEYDRLLAAHRKEIKAGQAFLDRPDIVDMLAQARIVDGELAELRARYEKTHMDSTANLIRLKKERRAELENYYQNEGRKAGVIKQEAR